MGIKLMFSRFIVVLSAITMLAGCDTAMESAGIPGPAGPAGPVGPEGPQGPSFILALGTVNSDGTLIRGVAVDGLSVDSVRTATGRYTVTVSGPGAFSGVIEDQIVVGLTPRDAQEDNVLAATVLASNADSLEVGVSVVDVEGGAAGTLVDDIFYFQIFLIP